MEEKQIEKTRMTLGEHLEELRKRIIYSLIAVALATSLCILFREPIIRWLMHPVIRAMAEQFPGEEIKLVLLSPAESFSLVVRICIIVALFLTSPFIFWQMWLFVSAGLYPHEKRYVRIFAPLSMVLFVAGVFFAFYVVTFWGVRFLLGIVPGDIFRPQFTGLRTLSFILRLALGFGIVFEMPLVMLVLDRLGLVGVEQFRKFRRHAILGIFIIAALFTPPDASTQVLMAVPMVLLYELGIILAKLRYGRRRDRKSETESSQGNEHSR